MKNKIRFSKTLCYFTLKKQVLSIVKDQIYKQTVQAAVFGAWLANQDEEARATYDHLITNPVFKEIMNEQEEENNSKHKKQRRLLDNFLHMGFHMVTL